MGGIGKTVLAKALTEDEVVQRAFPDGIVWITAGKERKRDFIEEMREVAKALGDDLSGYDSALACEHQYRTTIASKAALIVVDAAQSLDSLSTGRWSHDTGLRSNNTHMLHRRST